MVQLWLGLDNDYIYIMKKLILLLSVLFVVSCEKDVVMYTLTTSANPTIGGTVSPTTKQYEEGESVSLIATPAAEYVFDKWTGAEGTEETTIVMSSDKTVVANFIKKKYALTITIEGEGTVTEKVIKAGAATDYNSGTIVELTATPSTGWSFVKWDGDLTGSENPIEITIDKAQTLTAVFEQNLIVFLKGKVYYTNSPGDATYDAGKTYVQFDFTYLGESSGGLYEGWRGFYKENDDIEEKGCFTTGVVGANIGLEADTIINNSKQLKLYGIYGQTYLFTKKSNNKIQWQAGAANVPIADWDEGFEYELMSKEEFNKLDCK